MQCQATGGLIHSEMVLPQDYRQRNSDIIQVLQGTRAEDGWTTIRAWPGGGNGGGKPATKRNSPPKRSFNR
jgi:hypothetical protein